MARSRKNDPDPVAPPAAPPTPERVKRPRRRKREARETPSSLGSPELVPIAPAELEEIVRAAEAAAMPAPLVARMRTAFATLAFLFEALSCVNATLARVRRLFGLKASEKGTDIFPNRAGGSRPTPTTEPSSPEADADDPESGTGKKRRRAPGHGRKSPAAYPGAKPCHVAHEELKPGESCPACGEGKVYPRPERPRQLVTMTSGPPIDATLIIRDVMRCNLCGKEFVAPLPTGMSAKKYDAKAAAMLAMFRYGFGMAFNRLARLQDGFGIPISVSTMWEIVAHAARRIAPAFRELIRHAAQGKLIHNDDTTMVVLDLAAENKVREQEFAAKGGKGKKPRTGIFTTAIISCVTGLSRIVLFFTGRQHAGENLRDVLAERLNDLPPPVQMTDGLDTRNVPKGHEITVANCLVHARRNFVELIASFPTACEHVIDLLGAVFKHDADARKKKLSDAERLAYHQQHSRPLMNTLHDWLKKQFDERLVEPNGTLGGAINYMIERWDKLTLFLREPGAPLHNNVAERDLKRVIMHRKNSLFYKTMNGAQVGDLFMSLIHSAEQAGANPFDYLVALIENAKAVAQVPSAWMPWNYTATLKAGETTAA